MEADIATGAMLLNLLPVFSPIGRGFIAYSHVPMEYPFDFKFSRYPCFLGAALAQDGISEKEALRPPRSWARLNRWNLFWSA
jgi:hypothetical protein